jgi:hypothetical protein
MRAKIEFLLGFAVICVALYNWKTHSIKQLVPELIAVIFFWSLCIRENMKRND